MALKYIIAPYVEIDDPTLGTKGRKLALCDLYPPQQVGQPEPWQECESPGNVALAWTELPTTGLTGCVVLPDAPLTAKLSDFSAQERQTLRDIWIQMGKPTPPAGTTWGEIMIDFVNGRLQERWDELTQSIKFDGPVAKQNRVLPWQMAGGAFPTTGVIDNFNRADANPAGGWHSFSSPANRFIVAGNRLDIAANAANECIGANANDRVYGPDCEAYLSHPVAWASTNSSNQSCLWVRLQLESNLTAYSYFIFKNSTPATRTIRRTLSGTTTTLGANFDADIADGYRQGIEVIGTTIAAYEDTGSGTWTQLTTRTDSNIVEAGEIGLTWGRGTGSVTARGDNFGGGTVVVSTFPTTNVLETFNRANGAVGADWTDMFTGGSGGLVTALRGQSDGNGSGFWESRWNRTTFGPNTEVFATCPVAPTGVFVLWARMDTTVDTPSGYYCTFNVSAVQIELGRIDAGVAVPILQDTLPTLANGDALGFKVTGTGASIALQAWRKPAAGSWGMVTSTTDTDNVGRSTGYIGLSEGGTTMRVDDFGGGTILGSGTNFNFPMVAYIAYTDDESITFSGAWPPNGAGSPSGTQPATTTYASKNWQDNGGFNVYSEYNTLLQWDTSFLDATPASATLKLWIADKTDTNNYSLRGDYYNWGGNVDATDWIETGPGSSIFTAVDLTGITIGQYLDLPLTDLTGIDINGTTFIRLTLTSGTPTGSNGVTMQGFGTNNPPILQGTTGGGGGGGGFWLVP